MLKLIAEADKHEFDGELTAVISDPVVLGLGQAIVNREGELKKKYDDKVRLITLEKTRQIASCRRRRRRTTG